jgi:serine/threonine-protein kinase
MAFSTILSPGVNVGGTYQVIKVIGFGAMGVVYKVREQVGAVRRIRALKTVLPQFASDPAVVRRFRREAEKMCMLEHENIVPVLSYSEEGQFPYLVMPFIEGKTLKEYLAGYIAEHGAGLPLSEVIEIGLEVVRGLEIAHGFVNPENRQPEPMVHRDIKPGNIMVRVVDENGERRLKVLIMDFGIAKHCPIKIAATRSRR